MTRAPNPIPLRPDYSGARRRVADAIFRSAAVVVRAAADQIPHDEAAEQLGLERDEGVRLVLKGAVTPTSLANVGFTSMGVADLAALAPASATVGLLANALQVSLVGRGAVQVPAYLTSAADAGSWVAEGSPIRVRGLSLATGLMIYPRKLGVITAFTAETSLQSNIEAVVRAVLSRAVELALDAAVFSSAVDDGTTPGGILNGIADSGADAGTGQAAMIADVSTLVSALSAKGGGTNVVFITDPAAAMRMKLWSPQRFDAPILASSAITTDTVVAVEAGAFVAAFQPVPEISASTEAAIHQENTTPLPIVDGASTPAPNTRSLWQTDCIALRTILRGNWGARGDLVAKIDSVNW